MMSLMHERFSPPANVYESNGQLSVALPVPGAHPESTAILVEPDRLSVEAVCKYPQESQHYLRQEWKVGSWHLDLPLPMRVEPSRARATLNYGVLVVMAPISEASSGSAQVAVD